MENDKKNEFLVQDSELDLDDPIKDLVTAMRKAQVNFIFPRGFVVNDGFLLECTAQ